MGKKKLDHLKVKSINRNIELALKWLAKSGIQNNNKNILKEYGAFNAWYDFLKVRNILICIQKSQDI